ncbi:hypothetical protein [Sphingomonas glaciei]|uniref:Uncharacterized protein n=1 Tax=Sphingomonas glaciei TaxID=2938948 RepID=A0ABY5MWW3_9SPHN|nr:hypothetical protein [Sphingomonas glaciei]UUR08768.1 hypothetical protein M1K48_03795 [Sphingomonas glaciei]
MVDYELSSRAPIYGSLIVAVGALFALPPQVILREPWSLIGAALLSGSWFAFAGWRAWRLLRATALKGDQSYDRDVRPMLSKEYRDSESATAARRRKRNPTSDGSA